jgi:hypothetical protein
MPANISDQNRIDIIVRLLTDLSSQDKARVMREFSAMGKSGKAAGRQMTEGFEEAQRASTRLADNVIDVHRALQDLARTAGRVGEIGALGAAQVDLAEGFDYLAERANLDSGKLIAAMQKAAKGTVDANAIMRASNMVLGAQFDITTNDMVKMMEFARLKSKQYSLSVEAAFSRMVFGAVKAEVEFLDELGITIRLNDALKLYADSLGVATSALTSKQRAMAIWKAILLDADNQLTEYGGTVTKATDLYEQWEIRILELTQSVQMLVHKSGLGPFLFLVTKGIQGALPFLTTYILLKNLAATSALRHAQMLNLENKELVIQQKSLLGSLAGGAKGALGGAAGLAKGVLGSAAGAIGLGVGAGVLVYDNFTRKVTKTASVADIASKSLKLTTLMLGHTKTALLEGADAADEWARSHMGLKTIAEKSAEAEARNAAAIKDLVGQLGGSFPTLEQYRDRINQINAELGEGEIATRLWTKAQFDLRQGIREYGDRLKGVIEQTKELVAAQLRARQDGYNIVVKALQEAGLETDALRQKQDELNIALGKTTIEAIANRDALEFMAKAYAEGIVTVDRMKEVLEEGKKGLIEITAAERAEIDAVREARNAWREYITGLNERTAARMRLAEINDQIRQENLQAEIDSVQEIENLQAQATRDRVQALEAYQAQVAQINRNHARRMEDIEYNHQRRVQDINRVFAKTVRAAAIERDALAILMARETRAEQLGDAERDRQDQVRSEGRNHEESLRAAQEAYNNQIRELQRHLQEEITRQRASLDAQRVQNQIYHAAELEELRAHYAAIEAETRRHRGLMRALHSTRGGGGRRQGGSPPPTDPREGMRRGGHGVVTGPAGFYVEPGVREAYWFSGSLAGRGTSPVPGSTTHTMNQNLQIGGNMGVDVRGLGQSLSDKLGPQIAQLVMDSIAEGLGG